MTPDKDMAFLLGAAVTVLCLFVDQLRAGNPVYAENPTSGKRNPLTLDWA